jgi:hypothetical protein
MDAKDLAIHYSPIFESLRFFWTLTFFIYSIDSSPDQNKKKNVAREIIRKHIRNESGVISIQVLQEFYMVFDYLRVERSPIDRRFTNGS